MSRNYQIFLYTVRILVLLLILSSFLSCTKQEPVEESYVVKVDDQLISEAEVMVYAYQVYEEFIEIGGENVWEFEDFSGGKSATEVAKDAVIKNIIRIKTLQKKSEEFRIILSQEQITKSQTQGLSYFEQMPEDFKQKYGVTSSTVEQVFIEFARANNVYNDLTSDLAPKEEAIGQLMLEHSEYRQLIDANPQELLTQIHAQRIFIAEDDEQSAESQMEEIRKAVLEGEVFSELLVRYNDSEESTVEYTIAFIPDELKQALIGLEVDELSQVIVQEQGAYLFKIIDIIEPSETILAEFEENFQEFEDSLRMEAIEKLKSEHFDILYEEWRRNTRVEINKEQWAQVEFDFK